MSKKRKNFHYHYAEQFENQHNGRARGRSRRMPVPPFALFVTLLLLMLFGLVTTSFSLFVKVSYDDPNSPIKPDFIVNMRNRSLSDDDKILSEKTDLADTGAVVDSAQTGATNAFVPGTTVYLKPNDDWTTNNAYGGAYFYNDTTNSWADEFPQITSSSTYYSYTVPTVPADGGTTWTHVIFVRKGDNNKNWENKWNQTGDLAYSASNNCCVITGWNAGELTEAYDPNPAPTISTSKGSDINICGGSNTTTVTASFTSSDYELSSVEYSTGDGASIASISGTNNATFTGSTAGTYTVTATYNYYLKGFSGITKNTSDTNLEITVTNCSISTSPSSVSEMKIGDKVDVTFTGDSHHSDSQSISVSSADSSYVKVTTKTAYSSSDKSIVVTLTALKPTSGVKITATCDSSGAKEELTVSVTEPTVSANALSLYEGEQGTMTVNSTDASVTPTYTWSKYHNSAPITLAAGSANNQQIVTANGYSSTYATTYVTIKATYKVDNATAYEKTINTAVTLKQLPLTIGSYNSSTGRYEVSLYELQDTTITPSYSQYTPSSFSWTKESGNLVSLSNTTAKTVSVSAGVSDSIGTIKVYLDATYSSLNNYQKTVECTVVVNPIQVSYTADGTAGRTMTKTEGMNGVFAATVTPAPLSYEWTESSDKVELDNADTDTVTVKTSKLDSTADVTADVILKVSYGANKVKIFNASSKKCTVTIQASPYYLLGFGPSANADNWTTTNAARRMVYNPKNSRYEVTINLAASVYTNFATNNEYGFKLYNNGSYYSCNSATTINKDTEYPITMDTTGKGGDFNIRLQTNKEATDTNLYAYTFSLDVSSGSRKMYVEFPMDSVKVYDNITDEEICSVDVPFNGSIDPDDVIGSEGFSTISATLRSMGFIFSNSWDCDDPEAQDHPLTNITDASRKVYAVFVPKSPTISPSLLPDNRILSGEGLSSADPYKVPYGSTIRVSATLTHETGVSPDNDIAYYWYTGSTPAATGQSGRSFTDDTIVSTVPAGAKEFTLSVQASCTDVLNKTRTDDFSSVTRYYEVNSAFSGVDMYLNNTLLTSNQKIYSTPPDLKLKIYADLRAFEIDTHTPDDTKQSTLFAKTIELLRLIGDGSEVLSSGGSISADTAVPDYKSEVAARSGDAYTVYGAERGVNYLEFKLKDGANYESGSSYDFRTVVGTNNNYPSRPLYFEDTTDTLSGKRVMLFYIENNRLKYQTAEHVDDSTELYRFELPRYQASADAESRPWDGNVWIVAFNKTLSGKYALPVYDGEVAELSFDNCTSILYAKTAPVSTIGYQKLSVTAVTGTSINVAGDSL